MGPHRRQQIQPLLSLLKQPAPYAFLPFKALVTEPTGAREQGGLKGEVKVLGHGSAYAVKPEDLTASRRWRHHPQR